MSPAQLAIASVRAKGTAEHMTITPPWVSHARTAHGHVASLDLSLDASEIAALEAALPAAKSAGTRYAAAMMAMPDSERSD